jgi:hypothetical protein
MIAPLNAEAVVIADVCRLIPICFPPFSGDDALDTAQMLGGALAADLWGAEAQV